MTKSFIHDSEVFKLKIGGELLVIYNKILIKKFTNPLNLIYMPGIMIDDKPKSVAYF